MAEPGLSLVELIVRQREAWQTGRRLRVEDLLEQHPEFREQPEAVLDLIYNEVVLREERGEAPRFDEYLTRFPHLAEPLKLQFELDEGLSLDRTTPPARDPQPSTVGAPPPPPAGDLPAVPGCDVLGELGRGAMGAVYRAWQRGPNRVVALKVIHVGVPAARVRTEAEAAARLQHAHVVQVFEVKEHAGRTCLLLEYVEGGNLARKLAGRPQPPAEAARFVEVLARAMAYAHGKGVVHRDLKPSNVLLEGPPEAPLGQCTPKISDFGLAKLLAGGASLTRTTDILGTPSYMAPEQAGGTGEKVGPPADVYSLGAILYECLTGRPPFLGETVLDTLAQLRTQDPVPPRRLNPAVPRDLETVCLKCLHKSPGRRYASAGELAEDLRSFLAGEPIRARPTGLVERSAKWARRSPAGAALLAVSVAAALSLVGMGLHFTRQVRDQRDLANRRADELDDQLQRTRRLLFTAQLLRVGSVWERDPLQGLHMLEDPVACPADLRDFAWGVLYCKCKRFRLALPGHAKKVAAVAFNRDGSLLASGGYDGQVKIWDPATGKELRTLHEHTNRVSALAFSPEGELLASTGYDGTVKLWDVGRGAVRASARVPGGRVASVCFSPDGRLLATNGGEPGRPGTLTLWYAGPRLTPLPLAGAWNPACAVCFSPDGRLLACGGLDRTVKLWSVGQRREVRSLRGHNRPVQCVAFSPDGLVLASGGPDETVRLWEPATGEALATLEGGGAVSALGFGPDGQTLAAGFESPLDPFSEEVPHPIQLWDLVTRKPAEVLRGHRGSVSALAFSPDRKTMASGGSDRVVRLWDVPGRRESVDLRGHSGSTGSVVMSPDGQTLAWVSRGTRGTTRAVEVTVWDVARNRERCPPLGGHTAPVRCLAISPDGKLLASAEGGTDEPIEMRLWELATGKLLRRMEGHRSAIACVCFSPDSATLATASWDHTVKLWDVASGKVRHTLRGHKQPVFCVAFSPDGKVLASGGGEVREPGELKLWDARTGELLRDLAGHASRVTCVCFGPGGKALASGGRDGVIKLWDLGDDSVRTLPALARGVTCLALSPDGQTLASGGPGTSVQLWDAWMGQERAALPGHAGGVCYVGFSAGGGTLATASQSHTARLWHAVFPGGGKR